MTAKVAGTPAPSGEGRLTSKGVATRRRIVEGAAELIREHGVAETTLDEVGAHTRTSRSQLFHYFPDGKEQLLLAVAEHEADRVIGDQQPFLGDLTSWPAWLAWRDVVVERYRRQGRRCPLNALTNQLGRSTPGAQAVVGALIRRWEAELVAGVRALQAAGGADPGLDPQRAAAALLAGIQGGVLLLMSTGRLEYLEAALDQSLAGLRGTAR